jgi:hypothetical protein
MSRVIAFGCVEFSCRSDRNNHALARALAAIKSLARNSRSEMCGSPSQQAKKREIASVRNKLFSLARIAPKESQIATKVTSGDSSFPEAQAKTPRYPPCWRANSITEERIVWKSRSLPERIWSCQTRACRPSSQVPCAKKRCSSSPRGTPNARTARRLYSDLRRTPMVRIAQYLPFACLNRQSWMTVVLPTRPQSLKRSCASSGLQHPVG